MLLAPLALAGCATQADWTGERRAASDECRLAAQLFVVDGQAERAALAEDLRGVVGDAFQQVLDFYAEGADSDAEADPEAAASRSERIAWAQGALQQWAVLACGPGVGELPDSTAGLAEVSVIRGEAGGMPLVTVLGATGPDHALALCEEARAGESAARIEVKDADGFPLAQAEPGAPCGYDPALLGEAD
ncbi:MAG: hypothetical protein BGO95_03075 [Micrococcales bacterium 73-13]|nr:MAG: hypothetical protein BGO95_03075 [Micrococcales bacterium 73-13]